MQMEVLNSPLSTVGVAEELQETGIQARREAWCVQSFESIGVCVSHSLKRSCAALNKPLISPAHSIF